MLIQYESKSASLPELLHPYGRRLKQDPKLPSLEILHCSLKSLTNAPRYLLSLTILKVNFCQLLSLGGVDQFPQLHTLQAKYNRITNINSLRQLDCLVSVNLVGNPICVDRREFLEMVSELAPTVKRLNGEGLDNYQRLVGPEEKKTKKLGTLPSFKSLSYTRTTSASTLQTDPSEHPSAPPQNTTYSNTGSMQRLRLQKFALPIFQSQSYFCQPTIELSEENDGSTFQMNTEGQNIANSIDRELEALADMFHRNSLFRKGFRGLLGGSGQSTCRRATGNQLQRAEIRDWVIECFYALKYRWQLARAYRRKSSGLLETNKQHQATRNKVQMSLDIDMINETAESEWRNKTLK